MQKTTSYLSAILLLCAVFISCGENSKQQKAASSLTEPAAAAMIAQSIDCDKDSSYLPKTDAIAMMATFQSVFQSKESGLSGSIWFDSCVIAGFTRLIESGKYDGVRFYNAAASKEGTGTNNPSFFVLTPTIAGKDTWGKVLTVAADCSTQPASFNLEQSAANELIYNFGQAYREEGKFGDHSTAKNDSLSISIWINKCVFEKIAVAIKEPSNNIDGFRIYAAAYQKMYKAPGQKYDHQSTIFIVPTNKDGAGGHKDNWTIFNSAKEKSGDIQLRDSGAQGGLNHGGLCPTDCP